MTLALKLADGTLVEVQAGVHCMRFIGRYSRISAFGPLGTRITGAAGGAGLGFAS